MHRAGLVALSPAAHDRAAARADLAPVDRPRQSASRAHARLQDAPGMLEQPAQHARPRRRRAGPTDRRSAHTAPRSARRCRCRRRSSDRAAPRRSRAMATSARGHAAPRRRSAGPRRADRARGCAGRGGGRRARDRATRAPGPPNCTAQVAFAVSASQALRGERAHACPSAYTCQAPVMRRCEWRMRPLSKPASRCLPRASTDSSTRPSSASASPWRRLVAGSVRGHAMADERRHAQRRELEVVPLGQG